MHCFILFIIAICSIKCHLYSVFFFKQKTAYEMRISDWSSDVCSSDLDGDGVGRSGIQRGDTLHAEHLGLADPYRFAVDDRGDADRKSVVKGKSVSVRVVLGGRRIIKKHTITSASVYTIT